MNSPIDSGDGESAAGGDEERRKAAQMGLSFLTAMFAETDTVVFRPIESWTEGGRKRSQVHYKQTIYPNVDAASLRTCLLSQLAFSEREPANLFFGVCPRFGGGGKYDLAWQIRTVRALWADIDHVTVDAALAAVAKTRLPEPSAIVHSGYGVHFYWLLDEPYLIDDVGDPQPVQIEWREDKHGKKKPIKYILEEGERVYLDQRPLVAQLSQKALAIQDTLAGIAQAVDGDHTTDLARLLRIPGTLNRKDQRNGKPPVPSTLVECEPERRYPLSAFAAFKGQTKESKRAEQIARIQLPTPRKLSHTKGDKLGELISTCAVAEAGRRSEADFAVCCFALRHGLARNELWSRVAGVGKFADRGESYFDVTWRNAELEVRGVLLDNLLRKEASPPTPSAGSTGDAGVPPAGDEDAADADTADGRPTIVVDPANTPVATTLGRITAEVVRRGDYFSRADQLVQLGSDEINGVLTAAELAGHLSRHVEFFFTDGEEGEYKPLPPAYSNTWLNNRDERRRLPRITLYTRNPVYSDDWRLVANGFDPDSGIYYAGPAVMPREGTERLDALLADFCFQTTADRTNYIGMLLTTVLIPQFIGSKPAVVFNGNQPGLGKSVLAQIIAVLRDGQHAETASYNPNDEEFEKRLGAIVRRGATTIIIDNAKTRGRNARIDSPCLERSITDPILSFRLLGESTSIRAENSHIFCLTANSAELSRDLLTRSVIVNLVHEGDPARRTFSIADPEGYAVEHRLELLGELLGMVERWKAAGMPRACTQSRFNKRGWGDIVGGVLETCGDPDFLGNAEEAATALDETRRDFSELMALMAEDESAAWPTKEMVSLCTQHSLLVTDLGEGSVRSLATKMGALASRYVGETFVLSDGRRVSLTKRSERTGTVYRLKPDPHGGTC